MSSYHELIACDKEIVKSILRLTGSVEGIKHQVQDYISTFNKWVIGGGGEERRFSWEAVAVEEVAPSWDKTVVAYP